MTFARSYTAKQLNRGEGMTFHPISGERLSNLEFSMHGQRWSRCIPLLSTGWGEREYRYEHLRCIAGGKKCFEEGEAYPSHWNFDPFTGKVLLQQKSNGVQTIRENSYISNLDWGYVPEHFS